MRGVAITIKQHERGYTAAITPPHGEEVWSTTAPMAVDALVAKLSELGCHQTDIGDAFYEANPLWLDNR
jgi:hypothetical protein